MFKITGGKGFHITFDSGWTVSVQFGPGNYSDNYHASFLHEVECGEQGSTTAEVWCFNGKTQWPSDPLGYQSPAQVLAILSAAAKGDFSELPE